MNDISRRTILAATAAGAFTVSAASAQGDGQVPQPQRPGRGGNIAATASFADHLPI